MLVKCLFLCAAFLSPSRSDAAPAAEGVKWETTVEAAQRLAQSTNRLVLIHFGGPWCEPCQRLEEQVFNQSGFGRELQAKYVAVKIDPRVDNELATKYAVRSVPLDVVITPRGQLIYKVASPTTAAAYLETMNRIAASVQPLKDTVVAATPATGTPAANMEPGPPTPDQADRYADYYRSRHAAAPERQAGDQPQPQTIHPAAREQPHTTAVSMRLASPAGAAAADVRPPSAPPAAPAKVAAANPPLALDGYCSVTLVDKRQWHAGDKRWGAIHRGRTYLFADEASQKAFLASPDRYSPVLSGNDPVMRLDHKQDVPGKRQHGAFYNDRIYLFTSEETFQQFDRDPARYTVEARQVMRR